MQGTFLNIIDFANAFSLVSQEKDNEQSILVSKKFKKYSKWEDELLNILTLLGIKIFKDGSVHEQTI